MILTKWVLIFVQMESRLADVWGSIRTNQRFYSNLTSSLDSVWNEVMMMNVAVLLR